MNENTQKPFHVEVSVLEDGTEVSRIVYDDKKTVTSKPKAAKKSDK